MEAPAAPAVPQAHAGQGAGMLVGIAEPYALPRPPATSKWREWTRLPLGPYQDGQLGVGRRVVAPTGECQGAPGSPLPPGWALPLGKGRARSMRKRTRGAEAECGTAPWDPLPCHPTLPRAQCQCPPVRGAAPRPHSRLCSTAPNCATQEDQAVPGASAPRKGRGWHLGSVLGDRGHSRTCTVSPLKSRARGFGDSAPAAVGSAPGCSQGHRCPALPWHPASSPEVGWRGLGPAGFPLPWGCATLKPPRPHQQPPRAPVLPGAKSTTPPPAPPATPQCFLGGGQGPPPADWFPVGAGGRFPDAPPLDTDPSGLWGAPGECWAPAGPASVAPEWGQGQPAHSSWPYWDKECKRPGFAAATDSLSWPCCCPAVAGAPA